MTALATVPRGTPLDDGSHYQRTIAEIPVASIDVGPNIRVDSGELDELTASIQQLGVLQPIKVRQAGDRWSVVWGQRRLLAARQAGLERIPAIIEAVEQTPARTSIEQLSENLQRKDLNPIEEAVALRAVLDADPALTQEALGEQLGRSRSWVANTLRLLGLADEVQTAVRTEAISASHAKAMVVLPAKQQRELVGRIVDGNLSSHDLERDIRWKQGEAEQEAAKVKRTERVTPKVVAVLEKEDVPKDARLVIHGPWDVDVEKVVKAVKAAGWKQAKSGYLYDERSSTCDCKVFRVEVAGRGASVKPACDNAAHRGDGHKEERARWEAEEKARQAATKRLGELVRADLEIARPRGLILRLLDWGLESWHQEDWATHVGHSDAEILDSIARHLVAVHRSRDFDLAGLIAELETAQGIKAKPARARKAAAE